MDIPLNLVGELSAVGLLFLVVWMILTDRLVTKGRLTEAKEETAVWRAKSDRELLINETQTSTIHNYAEAALVAKKVMRAVQEQHGIVIDEQSDGP